jgi:hypothetical protein
MRPTPLLSALAATILSLALHPASAQTALNDGFARDSRQPIDQAYTDHIRKYTTDRGEAIGSYDLVFNAILNYDHLRQPVTTPAPEQSPGTVPAER